MKLGTKLLLITFFLSVLPLLGVGSVAYVALREQAEHESEELVAERLEQHAAQLDLLVKQASRSLDLLAQDAIVLRYVGSQDDLERYQLMQPLLQSKLRMLQRVYPEYLEIRLIWPDGFEDFRITSRELPNRTEHEAHQPVFQALVQSGEQLWLRVQQSPDTGELVLFLGRGLAVESPGAEQRFLRAYLSMTVDLNRFVWPLQESPWPGGGLFMSRGDELLLASAALAPLLAADGLPRQQLFEHDSTGYLELGGGRFFHRRLQLMPDLWLHALVPEDVTLASSRTLGMLVWGGMLLTLLFGGPLLLYLLRAQLLRPVLQLRQAFVRLQQDENRLVELPVLRSDELGELTEAFNCMSYELHESSRTIRQLAYHDSLTGLPNRYLFLRTLQRGMQVVAQEKQTLALLFIDLDNFKVVNDTFGHPFGDQVLTEVSRRIQEHIRGCDYLGRANELMETPELSRLGGDEFTLLLAPVHTPYAVGMVAQRLISLISEPITLEGHECYLGASIGIAMYPGDGETPEDLVKNADLAMFQAKKQGKGHFEYFSAALGAAIRERTRLDLKLHKVVEQEGFELYFQPLMECADERIVSLEALIRWRDPEIGFVSPELFVPLAEESGLVLRMGDWVIREACRWVQRWRSSGFDEIRVAINVSGVQMSQPGIAELFEHSLQRYALPAEAIYIELTETSLIQGESLVLDNLHKLRAMGIRIALDDFGTGYSSLSYLRKLPIDILKIDKSFVEDLGSEGDSVILASIINMAHALEMKVVAEGVEDREMYLYLKREGVDLIQGYYLSKPRPALEVPKMLELDGAGLLLAAETSPG